MRKLVILLLTVALTGCVDTLDTKPIHKDDDKYVYVTGVTLEGGTLLIDGKAGRIGIIESAEQPDSCYLINPIEGVSVWRKGCDNGPDY